MERIFKVSHTNICKGVATLLLLFHHLFYTESRYSKVTFLIHDKEGIPLLSKFAVDSRVCVAVFLILSGIGIYIKLDNNKDKTLGKLSQHYRKVLDSLKKMMFSFWIVFAVFVPISVVVGKTLQLTYGKNVIKNFLIDFFGMTYVFHSPTMNGAWWYITVAIFSYLTAPLWYWLLQKIKWGMFSVVIIFIMG